MRASMVCVFLAYKKNPGRIETRTRNKKYLGGCGQFETSPDAIEPELRTALLILVLSSYLVYVMFRLIIVRMRPESGNSTYVTGRRPTRALEVQ